MPYTYYAVCITCDDRQKNLTERQMLAFMARHNGPGHKAYEGLELG